MRLRPRRTTKAAEVARLAHCRDVAGLIEAAGDVDASIRRAAIASLAEIGPGETVPAAIEALRHPSDQVRCAAVGALRHWAEPMPLAEAVSWLPAGSPSRAHALAAIAALDEPQTAALLADSLVRGRAQDGRWEDEAKLILDLCRSGRDSTARDEVMAVLTEALEGESNQVAGRAEDFLVRLGEDGAQALIALAESSPAPGRAVRVLGQIGGASALGPLIRAVEHADPRAREEACAALGDLRDPVSVEPLLRAMRDPEHRVRVKAAAALDHFGTATVMASLWAIVRDQAANAKPRPRRALAGQNGSAATAKANGTGRKSSPRHVP